MTTTYLGFLMNRQSREEFVAPVQADDSATARMELGLAFPESRYILQTVYSRTEMEHVLAGIDRWPGVPSKVQPPLTTDLSKVTARTGGLPPLPGQVKGTVQEVVNNTQAMPAWMQSFVQKNAQNVPVIEPNYDAPTPVAKPTLAQALAMSKAQQTGTPAPQPMLQAMSQPKTSLPQASLIDRLKAAKGETVKPAAMPLPSPQAQAKAGSVIDILKGMRK